MPSINEYEDDDVVINEILLAKVMLTFNISPKAIMTETCNYKLHCENHGNFFNENMRNLYFKLAAMLSIVC